MNQFVYLRRSPTKSQVADYGRSRCRIVSKDPPSMFLSWERLQAVQRLFSLLRDWPLLPAQGSVPFRTFSTRINRMTSRANASKPSTWFTKPNSETKPRCRLCSLRPNFVTPLIDPPLAGGRLSQAEVNRRQRADPVQHGGSQVGSPASCPCAVATHVHEESRPRF